MPELPEVETLVSNLKELNLINKSFKEIIIKTPKLIATPFFSSLLKDKKISDIFRRGKYLIFSLQKDLYLLIHLRMSGHLSVSNEEKLKKHEHVLFKLSDNRALVYEDIRKFGRLYLTDDLKKILNKLGPEPLDKNFSFSDFFNRLKKRKLKALLLDQSFIAGIGNIYADEALWEAKLHPEKDAKSLNIHEAKALYDAIRSVLKKGIENKGTSLGKSRQNFSNVYKQFGKNQDHLKAYHRDGLPCKRCKKNMVSKKIAQRSSCFCPFCQKLN